MLISDLRVYISPEIAKIQNKKRLIERFISKISPEETVK